MYSDFTLRKWIFFYSKFGIKPTVSDHITKCLSPALWFRSPRPRFLIIQLQSEGFVKVADCIIQNSLEIFELIRRQSK